MSLVFNLKIPTIRKYCLFEGRFNLLRAGIRYAAEAQGGRGLCVLSSATATQLRRNHRLLQSRRLNALGHPSRLKARKCESMESLKKQRELARRNLQHHGGLLEDPEAKVLLFVGPWAQHAGVEEIAEVLPQILCRHERAQVLLCGLCSDLSGVMAQDMLCRVMSSFPGRLCFLSERFELPEDLRRGVDFLLAPYLSEPIGQSDVEMGFLGVPTIGCAAGALGRMPGVYFHQQNSTGRDMLKTGFFGAVDYALSLSEDYWRLAKAATEATRTEASFGELWQVNLAKVYDEVQLSFIGRQGDDQEHFDDRLWNNAASQEELHSALAPRRSSTLRPISSTADLAHQMQVLDIDDDAEFLTQPVSESRAQEIMKAVAESLPYLSDHMDASELQRDISQARQRLQERSHMTRGLMKPFARGLCLRIHLVMAICYVTSSVGELLLHTLKVEAEVDGEDPTPPFNELWLSFYLALSLGSLLWLGLSYGVPPNLLMTASQGLNLLAFMLLPLLPDHLHEASWSYLSFVAMSGVQSSSKLLFILWNFNEDTERGFEVAIWRLGILEALRRSMAYLALLATYAGNLWIYKQLLFVISFTALVLLFKTPYCYATHVLPSTGLRRLGCSFWLFLLAEVFTSLGSYTQDVHGWLSHDWSSAEMQLMILAVVVALPLILHTSFGHLRRMQVWGPWALRDFACFLPSGALLRVVALYDSRGSAARSSIFAAALLLSIVIDTMRHVAILSAAMTVLGSRWNALKGCYLLLSVTALAMAMSPWFTRYTATLGGQFFEELQDSLGTGVAQAVWATPLALLGYVFQASAAFFFNHEVLTFKKCSPRDVCSSVHWLWVAQVKRRLRLARAKLCQLQDRAQEEEVALEQVQAVIEESFSLPSLLSPKGGKHLWDTPKNQVLPMEESDDPVVPDEQQPCEELWKSEDRLKVVFEEPCLGSAGLPAKDYAASSSAVSFSVTEFPATSVAEESQEDKDGATTVSATVSFDVTPLAEGSLPSHWVDKKDFLAPPESQDFEEHDDVASAAVSVESEDLPKSPVLLERCILEDDRPADVEDCAISLDEPVPIDSPKADERSDGVASERS